MVPIASWMLQVQTVKKIMDKDWCGQIEVKLEGIIQYLCLLALKESQNRKSDLKIECRFLGNNIIDFITKYTNIKINHIETEYTRERDAK